MFHLTISIVSLLALAQPSQEKYYQCLYYILYFDLPYDSTIMGNNRTPKELIELSASVQTQCATVVAATFRCHYRHRWPPSQFRRVTCGSGPSLRATANHAGFESHFSITRRPAALLFGQSVVVAAAERHLLRRSQGLVGATEKDLARDVKSRFENVILSKINSKFDVQAPFVVVQAPFAVVQAPFAVVQASYASNDCRPPSPR
ncbi:hypothetical protein LR48_Vigan07g225400 [Vigna angularis]|uniref:Uncharacterized protein n=1 Tax=Phaseolus angularis TaxID=3914 RepID=A0A0L9V0C5_PHAAN|nr:hypothetical protein LR48_Vigan07g225400 [Vigna angularis]